MRAKRAALAFATVSSLLAVVVLSSMPAESQMHSPFVVYGYVRDKAGDPVAGAQVTIVNLRTQEAVKPLDDSNLTTDGSGRYMVDVNDPALFPSGHTEGDILQITAMGPDGTGQRTVAYPGNGSSLLVDITLRPLASEVDEDEGLSSWICWSAGAGSLLLLAFLGYWLLIPPKEQD